MGKGLTALLGVIGLGTILTSMINYEPTKIIKEEFKYNGRRGYVEFSERHTIKEPLCSTIIFENGDTIQEGNITTDDGRKIRVYIPD